MACAVRRGSLWRRCTVQVGWSRPPLQRRYAAGEGLQEERLTSAVLKPFVAITTTTFLSNVSFSVIIPALPKLAQDLGLDGFGVGCIIAAPAAARVLCNAALGRAADGSGRKRLMVAGALLSATSAWLTAAAPSLLPLLGARLLNGVGGAATMAGSTAYMADLTAQVPHHRARLLGVQHAIIAVAFVMGPALGGTFAESFGVRPLFASVGGALCFSALGFSILPPAAPPAPAEKKKEDEGGWLELLLQSRDQQAVVAMNGVLFLGYTCQMTVVPLHAAAVWGASTGQIGVLFSAVSVTGLAGAPLGGYLADRFGRKACVVPAALLASVGAVSLSFADSFGSFLAAMAIWGVSGSLIGPGLNALAADAAPPQRRGEALALGRQAGDVAFLVGPLLLGALADAVSCSASLCVTAVMYPLAATFFALRATGQYDATVRAAKASSG